MSDYYLVKLKPDNRWLTDDGCWSVDRKEAAHFDTRFAAHDSAADVDPAAYEAGDIVIRRVRKVKAKTIPTPKVEVIGTKDFYALCVNGVQVTIYGDTRPAHREANALRRALGIPEET